MEAVYFKSQDNLSEVLRIQRRVTLSEPEKTQTAHLHEENITQTKYQTAIQLLENSYTNEVRPNPNNQGKKERKSAWCCSDYLTCQASCCPAFGCDEG